MILSVMYEGVKFSVGDWVITKHSSEKRFPWEIKRIEYRPLSSEKYGLCSEGYWLFKGDEGSCLDCGHISCYEKFHGI